MALKTETPPNELYIRVELPRLHSKYEVQFNLVQYMKHPITKEFVAVGTEVLQCPYLLDGDNVFTQCYAHVKSVLGYSTIDC